MLVLDEASYSRFEVDLMREREEAVNLEPEMAWGLYLRRAPLMSDALIEQSLQEYDAFYHELKILLAKLSCHYKRFVIFEFHAYNYHRKGPEGSTG